jgi:hypothetical protein
MMGSMMSERTMYAGCSTSRNVMVRRESVLLMCEEQVECRPDSDALTCRPRPTQRWAKQLAAYSSVPSSRPR